jgi:hypothetical protein
MSILQVARMIETGIWHGQPLYPSVFTLAAREEPENSRVFRPVAIGAVARFNGIQR